MTKNFNSNIKIKVFLLSFIFLFIIQSAWAQTNLSHSYFFEKYDLDKGLPSNTVFSITQDSFGFMWFGTRQGFCRFDGNNFKVFQPKPGEPNSPKCINSGNLFYDSRGKIWIGTWGKGVDLFDPVTEKFRHFIPDKKNPKALHGEHIQTVFEDSRGDFWFCSLAHGVARMRGKDVEKGIFDNFEFNPEDKNSVNSKRVRRVVEDKSGNLWFATDNGFCRLKPENREKHIFERFYLPPNYSLSNVIWSIYVTNSGDLLVGFQGGYLRIKKPEGFNGFKGEYKNLPKLPLGKSLIMPVSYFHEDYKGNLWIATTREGLLLTKNDRFLKQFKRDISLPRGFPGDQVSFLFEDKSHNLWIATNNNGIAKVDLKGSFFNSYFMLSREVHGFTEDKFGRIWFSSAKGLGIVDYANYLPFKDERLAKKSWSTYISTDYKGDIWTLVNRLNIVKINPVNFTVDTIKILSNNKLRELGEINDMIISNYENKKVFWIVTSSGFIYRYNIETCKLKEFFLDTTYDYETITEIFEDSGGNLWFGTANGLFLWKRDERAIEFEIPFQVEGYFSDEKNKNSLINNHITSINEDFEKHIWVGTLNGLSWITRENGKIKFRNFTTKHGLANNGIMGIQPTTKKGVWILTEHGLSYFHHKSHKFHSYYEINGLPNNKFANNANFRADNGEIYLGTRDGFVKFSENNFKFNSFKPTVVISEFVILNSGREIKGIFDKNNVELEPGENSFKLTLASLEYTNPKANKYFYKLYGFDEKWKSGLAGEKITYMNLPPGEYTFRYAGSNNARKWSKGHTILQIKVTPYFWETLTFRGVLATTIFLILIFIDYRRKRNIAILKRENEEKRRLLEELEKAKRKTENLSEIKSWFLSQMSHEIRTPLFTLSNSLEVIKNKDAYSDEEVKFALNAIDKANNRISRTIDLLLRMSDLSKGEYEPNQIESNIVESVKYIYSLYFKKANAKGLKYSLVTSADKIIAKYDPDAFEFILDNVINNAITYTEEGEVIVKVQKVNNAVEIEVVDSGPGIPDEKKEKIMNMFEQRETGYRRKFDGLGLGLTVAYHYCEKNNCKLHLYDNAPQGTIVQLVIK
jgi:ligand-binding sensor domain-containing protein/signal transduction histidine kinase